MAPWLSFILFPVVGAGIGLITNQIAIQMLFRPLKPIMIAGRRVPFTPGVIPAQREKIALRIARAFEANLFSRAELHELITGAATREILTGKVDEFFADFGLFGNLLGGLKPKVFRKVMETLEEVGAQALADGGHLDIARKIEERINHMPIEKLEALVLDVARRQLQQITLFGGVLGGLIGLAQASLSLLA